MAKILFYLAVFQVIFQIWTTNAEVLLNAVNTPTFPCLADSLFSLELKPKESSEVKLSDSQFDLIVIRVVDESNIQLEKAVFAYGLPDIAFQQFKGEFIKIPFMKKNTKDRTINMNIVFLKHSHKNVLEIYQVSAVSKDIQNRILKNLKLARQLYRSAISILIPPKLKMSAQSYEGKVDQLQNNELGVVSCQSFDGRPDMKPVFTNLDNFHVKDVRQVSDSNEIQAFIYTSLLDHLTQIKCRAGMTEESLELKILHRPSKVNLAPEVNNYIEFKDSIFCRHADGYPKPTSFWTFVSGPKNAKSSYEIDVTDGRKLTFLPIANYGSKWTFNCSAANKISDALIVFNRTVHFKVEDQLVRIFGASDEMYRELQQVEELKRYVYKKISAITSNVEGVYNNYVKLSQNNNNINSSLLEFKNHFDKQIIGLKKNDSITEMAIRDITARINKQEKRTDDLFKQCKENLGKTSKYSNEIMTLRQELNQQHKVVELLQRQTNSLALDLSNNTKAIQSVGLLSKLLLLDNINMMAQLKFVKLNLYWLVPIAWTITSISINNSETKTAISDPFYSPVKMYQMTVFLEVTKDHFKFYLYMPKNVYNQARGWPFRAYVTFIPTHKTFPTINKPVKKYIVITSELNISQEFKFDRAEMDHAGYLSDDSIRVICDVTDA